MILRRKNKGTIIKVDGIEGRRIGMREIRFRSWHRDSNMFIYATVERPFDKNFPVLYLSSGLWDVNGKEIFAGDIVELVKVS